MPATRQRVKYIYAIREMMDGPVKIGVAVNPEKRRTDLQSGNPRPLALLGYRPISHDAEIAEHQIRTRFEAYIVRGEWFDVRGDFSAFVQDYFVMGRPASWLEST